jgi:hypothetical protein
MAEDGKFAFSHLHIQNTKLDRVYCQNFENYFSLKNKNIRRFRWFWPLDSAAVWSVRITVFPVWEGTLGRASLVYNGEFAPENFSL